MLSAGIYTLRRLLKQARREGVELEPAVDGSNIRFVLVDATTTPTTTTTTTTTTTMTTTTTSAAADASHGITTTTTVKSIRAAPDDNDKGTCRGSNSSSGLSISLELKLSY